MIYIFNKSRQLPQFQKLMRCRFQLSYKYFASRILCLNRTFPEDFLRPSFFRIPGVGGFPTLGLSAEMTGGFSAVSWSIFFWASAESVALKVVPSEIVLNQLIKIITITMSSLQCLKCSLKTYQHRNIRFFPPPKRRDPMRRSRAADFEFGEANLGDFGRLFVP